MYAQSVLYTLTSEATKAILAEVHPVGENHEKTLVLNKENVSVFFPHLTNRARGLHQLGFFPASINRVASLTIDGYDFEVSVIYDEEGRILRVWFTVPCDTFVPDQDLRPSEKTIPGYWRICRQFRYAGNMIIGRTIERQYFQDRQPVEIDLNTPVTYPVGSAWAANDKSESYSTMDGREWYTCDGSSMMQYESFRNENDDKTMITSYRVNDPYYGDARRVCHIFKTREGFRNHVPKLREDKDGKVLETSCAKVGENLYSVNRNDYGHFVDVTYHDGKRIVTKGWRDGEGYSQEVTTYSFDKEGCVIAKTTIDSVMPHNNIGYTGVSHSTWTYRQDGEFTTVTRTASPKTINGGEKTIPVRKPFVTHVWNSHV